MGKFKEEIPGLLEDQEEEETETNTTDEDSNC